MPDIAQPRPSSKHSNSTSETATSKWAKLKSAKHSGSLSWQDASPDTLHAAIAAVTADGAAILLTATSDGGALVLRVISDTESTPYYASALDVLTETLLQITETAKTA